MFLRPAQNKTISQILHGALRVSVKIYENKGSRASG